MTGGGVEIPARPNVLAVSLAAMRIGVVGATGYKSIFPEFRTQGADLFDSLFQAFSIAGHAAFVQHNF